MLRTHSECVRDGACGGRGQGTASWNVIATCGVTPGKHWQSPWDAWGTVVPVFSGADGLWRTAS